jgi:hypothetical protein
MYYLTLAAMNPGAAAIHCPQVGAVSMTCM